MQNSKAVAAIAFFWENRPNPAIGRWRHHSEPGPQKHVLRVKTFYFARKSIWNITEPPGTFCTEQAQKITRRTELAPPRYDRCTFLAKQAQPSHAASGLLSGAVVCPFWSGLLATELLAVVL